MNFQDYYNGRKNCKDKNRIVYKKGIFLKSFMGGRRGGFSLYDLMCHMINTVRFLVPQLSYQRLHRAVSWMRKRPWVWGCYHGEMSFVTWPNGSWSLSYFRQGMPWARGSVNPESSKWWTKKVAGQMLRRGPIHSRDFVFVKPPRSVTWRNQYGLEGDY